MMVHSAERVAVTDQLTLLRVALTGRYTVERELGRGGMATVYLAQDLKHHRPVAIKILRAELAAALGAERFLREIEIAARLQHPHILPLYDSGAADGHLFYVMPYVEGESLRDRLRRDKQLSVDEAIMPILTASCTATLNRRTFSYPAGQPSSRTSASRAPSARPPMASS